MQKISLTIAFSALFAAPAFALPPIPSYVAQAVADKPEYEKFAAVFAGLKSKCDLCHTPGADKKAKGHGLNDYGHAVHEHLNDGEFKTLHKTAKENPADAKKALQLIVDSLEKAAADKNADGKTFGELIKAGQLPGK